MIAYGRGGAAETVRAGETGVFFAEQTAVAIAAAVRRFEGRDAWDAKAIRRHAERFGTSQFRDRITGVRPGRLVGVRGRLADHGDGDRCVDRLTWIGARDIGPVEAGKWATSAFTYPSPDPAGRAGKPFADTPVLAREVRRSRGDRYGQCQITGRQKRWKHSRHRRGRTSNRSRRPSARRRRERRQSIPEQLAHRMDAIR